MDKPQTEHSAQTMDSGRVPFFRGIQFKYAVTYLLLIALVLFTPLRIVFEPEALPSALYLQGLGLALIPAVVMELSKKFGLIKHQH